MVIHHDVKPIQWHYSCYGWHLRCTSCCAGIFKQIIYENSGLCVVFTYIHIATQCKQNLWWDLAKNCDPEGPIDFLTWSKVSKIFVFHCISFIIVFSFSITVFSFSIPLSSAAEDNTVVRFLIFFSSFVWVLGSRKERKFFGPYMIRPSDYKGSKHHRNSQAWIEY